MSHGKMEKRQCVRFEIPGAKVSIKKAGIFGLFSGFSGPLELVNLSKGGVGFESERVLKMDQKILVQLHVPGKPMLHLRGNVRWQASGLGVNQPKMTGVQFLPFGGNWRTNPREVLEVLSRLEDKYAEKETPRFSPGASEKEPVEIKIEELF
ncbi:MAG: PilZ domain-containing protein [Desulfobacterales bacterium]|nr:PilZ domain-containing protein [Desulfobacterales bacterium]MCF8079821.1 PilZ domain-containing protein [Desulfobacterales bacterium]